MKSNPAYVNAKYEGEWIWRHNAMSPYITVLLTKGSKKILNTIWLEQNLPFEMRHSKQLSLAWLRLVLDDGLMIEQLPDWWPKMNNQYFHRNETTTKT